MLAKQLFPYMDLSKARYGALVSSRTGTDGVVTLDTYLVDGSLSGVCRSETPGYTAARLGSAPRDIALPRHLFVSVV